MTKSRKQILEINPAFTRFIMDLQLSYKPEPYEEGESVILDLDDDEGTILSKELTGKLNTEQFEAFEKSRDINPFLNSDKLEFIESRLLISPKESTTEYLNDIAYSLEKLRVELKESHLMILGVQNTPWLSQENEYLPVKNALAYLKQSVDKDFDGGFLLKENSILEFIPHLFWLTRCNASLPYFYMSFPGSKTAITICKYGVVHFEFYGQDEKIKILQLLADLNFKELDNCGDPIEFDGFDGREISK